MIFCGLVAWQRYSSCTDVPANLICDAAWSRRICGWLWLAEGGERLMTHRLTTLPLRDRNSNTEKSCEFLPQSRERISFFERGKGWGYIVEPLTAWVWTDMDTVEGLFAFMPYQIIMLRWHYCAWVNSTICVHMQGDSPLWARPPVLLPCSPSCPSVNAGCWPVLWLLWSASSGPTSPSPACLSPLPGLLLHPHSPEEHTHKNIVNRASISDSQLHSVLLSISKLVSGWWIHDDTMGWVISVMVSMNCCSSIGSKFEGIVWLILDF